MGDIAKYCKCKLTKIYFTRLTCEQRACLIFTNLNIQKVFFFKDFWNVHFWKVIEIREREEYS